MSEKSLLSSPVLRAASAFLSQENLLPADAILLSVPPVNECRERLKTCAHSAPTSFR